MSKKTIYLFWGVMDFLYIVRFCYVSYEQGQIPLYDDFHSFILLAADHGALAIMLFSLSLMLNLSMFISMILFFRESRYLPWLVYVQTPLRLVIAIPSLMFIPWLAKAAVLNSITLLLSLLVMSELLKCCSVFFRDKFLPSVGRKVRNVS